MRNKESRKILFVLRSSRKEFFAYFCKKIPPVEDQKKTDEKFMRLALNEARKALQLQEVPIGAVVVADGAVDAAIIWSRRSPILRPMPRCRR